MCDNCIDCCSLAYSRYFRQFFLEWNESYLAKRIKTHMVHKVNMLSVACALDLTDPSIWHTSCIAYQPQIWANFSELISLLIDTITRFTTIIWKRSVEITMLHHRSNILFIIAEREILKINRYASLGSILPWATPNGRSIWEDSNCTIPYLASTLDELYKRFWPFNIGID